jgi:hypothetical protein
MRLCPANFYEIKANINVGFFIVKPTRCTDFTNLFCHETLHVLEIPLSLIRRLFVVHSAMVYVIQALYTQLASRTWSCSQAVHKPVWHIPLLSVQWINSWWWTEELSKTCRVSWQNKFVKLVHLIGFIIKKFVTMQHGHMNVLSRCTVTWTYCNDARSHEHTVTMHGHMNVLSRCTVTWT